MAHLARTSNIPQQIPHPSGVTYHVPAKTMVYVSAACMSISRSLWGDDALMFRPTRWLHPDGEFVEPPRGSFLAWSAGPRDCPGRKMSKVEFVGVMMTVFHSWKVAPVVLQGETAEMARERLRRVVADSQPIVTLQMKRPGDVLLRWEEVDRVGSCLGSDKATL